MRLIDADEFKNEVKCEMLKGIIRENTGNALLGVIDIQPTAYDVEKVVAELEKEKEIHTEHYNISLYKDYPEVKQRYEQMQLVIDDAIAKVRKGGVE